MEDVEETEAHNEYGDEEEDPLSGKAAAESRTIVLPSELITRRSTAPLSGEAVALTPTH